MSHEIIAKIEELFHKESNYALDIYFGKYFAELTGRPETSVLHQIRSLQATRETDLSGKGKYERALRSACESIWDWYNKADSYRAVGTAVALDMLETHDPVCLWAVMLGQIRTREVSA